MERIINIILDAKLWMLSYNLHNFHLLEPFMFTREARTIQASIQLQRRTSSHSVKSLTHHLLSAIVQIVSFLVSFFFDFILVAVAHNIFLRNYSSAAYLAWTAAYCFPSIQFLNRILSTLQCGNRTFSFSFPSIFFVFVFSVCVNDANKKIIICIDFLQLIVKYRVWMCFSCHFQCFHCSKTFQAAYKIVKLLI